MAVSNVPAPRGTGVAFVTGAGGFLGWAAASAFRRAGWRVAALGHPPRPGQQGLSPTDLWIEGDIEIGALRAAADRMARPEVLFHAAGGASVGASLADPEADRARTVGSLRQTLAYLTADAPCARLIYPSSAAIYGEAAQGPIPESAPAAPVSPYGRHKADAERLIQAAGLDAVIIRFFSVYGPGLHKQLLWELAGRLAADPAELELSGDGEEARDFLYVDDAMDLVALAAGLDELTTPLVLNGGAGRAVTVRQAADALRRSLGRSTSIRFSGKGREGDPRSLVADISRARALGFGPAVSLEQGLAGLADWLARRPDEAGLGLRQPASY
jgi:UDP-glucose 4-epimerase